MPQKYFKYVSFIQNKYTYSGISALDSSLLTVRCATILSFTLKRFKIESIKSFVTEASIKCIVFNVVARCAAVALIFIF